MNKILGITAILMTAMFATSVLADTIATATVYCIKPSDCTMTTLNLENKDASWKVIGGDDISATLTFGTEGPKFTGTLTTSGLQDKDYALIYYKDQTDRFNSWNGAGGVVIATFHDDVTDKAIDNDIGSLPKAGDWNIAPSPDYCAGHNGWDYYAHCTGAKIWIVPTSDLTSGPVLPLTVWNPTTYLFETDLVTYTKGNPTTTCVDGQCVPITCGIELAGSPAFGSMVQGTTYQSPTTTTVKNTGNVPENPTISGDYWYGSKWLTLYDGYWMPIGATQWTVTDWASVKPLTSTPTSIGTLSPLGTATVWYQLTVPSPQPTDSYTQTITFGTGC